GLRSGRGTGAFARRGPEERRAAAFAPLWVLLQFPPGLADPGRGERAAERPHDSVQIGPGVHPGGIVTSRRAVRAGIVVLPRHDDPAGPPERAVARAVARTAGPAPVRGGCSDASRLSTTASVVPRSPFPAPRGANGLRSAGRGLAGRPRALR